MADEAGAPAKTVAYFTMEVALDDALPTYSGGLGVLAGDHLRAAADAGVPMVGVTLLYRDGYFDQRIGGDGAQREEPVRWDPEDRLEAVPAEVRLEVRGEPVAVGAWRSVVTGVHGHEVPVLFLDTDRPGNSPAAAALTGRLYGGDEEYRLAQEAVLGLGGVALLEALGLGGAGTFHLNEGHSALLTLALWRAAVGRGAARDAALDTVRRRCVFTTHTPVPAGHDRFPAALVERVLGRHGVADLRAMGALDAGRLDMTRLAITGASYVNAVSRRHGEVTRAMFPGVEVHTITNGVHVPFWAATATAELFDRRLPAWRADAAALEAAADIPLDEMRAAHDASKQALLDEVEKRTGRRLDPKALTLGFARRATPYKRMSLLFSDPERLAALSRDIGPLQVLLAGKAHPKDEGGKSEIRAVFRAAARLAPAVEVVYLEGYCLALARLLCAGADVWLNTPRRPHEASGTSGMKAAVNGVPSLSVLDGWWVEGHVDGVTGWAVGPDRVDDGDDADAQDADDAADLYRALGESVLPLFFGDADAFAALRRSTIARNAARFSTERMVAEYCRSAYATGA